MIYGVVLAGGTGKRMRSRNLPKQFIKLNGTPTIILTINKMLKVERFDKLFIAVHPSWVSYLEDMIDAYIPCRDRITVIEGGSERLDSISNSVYAAVESHPLSDDDIIVLHDAVRPFITKEVLEASIDGAKEYSAVVAAVPATDTMLWINDGEVVESMPDRSKLFHGQAPDSFKLHVLKESLESLTDEECAIITGTAQICMLKGIPVHIIPGDRNNIKLTTPEDLIVARGLLLEEAYL